MAQYNTHHNRHMGAGTRNKIHEVVMTADHSGNIINSFGAASNINIAAGLVTGHSHINKFGFNNEVPTTFEVIALGSSNFTYPTTAGVVTLVSTDANDDDGDTGARTVSLQGLDSDYNQIEETVTLNGQTNVTSTKSFLRLFRMRIETAGSSGGGEGTITATVGGNELSRIEPDFDNQTLQAAYTVPADKTGYLIRMQATSTKDNKAAMVGLFTRSSDADSVFTVKQLIEVYRNNVVVDFPVPIEIPAKTDIELRGKNLNSGNVSIGGTFDLILIDN